MQTVSTAYGLAAGQLGQTYAQRITIGWPSPVPVAYQTSVELTIVSAQLTREMQTDMPAGTRLVAGRASAELDLTLSGLVDTTPTSEDEPVRSIAWLLGQYQATSPMFRQSALTLPVTYDIGLLTGSAAATVAPYEGVEFVRVFTGFIDDYTVDMAAGTAALVCLDGKAKLTTVPALPPVVAAAPDFALLTPEFALDAVIRPQYLTWPARRADCVLAAGMRGSAWPEVGGFNNTLVPITTTLPSLVPGKFGTAVTGEMQYNLSRSITPANVFIEAWSTVSFAQVSLQDSDSSSFNDSLLMLVSPTEFSLISEGDTNGTVSWSGATPTDGLAHYFAVQINGRAVTMHIDGATQTFTFPVTPAGTFPYCQVQATGSIEALQVATEPAGAPSNSAFRPSAVLDPSLHVLTALPDVSGSDTWSVVQDIADAEQGIAYFTEFNVFRFLNRNTLSAMPAVHTFGDSTSLVKLQIESSQAALANHIQVPVNQLAVSKYASVWDLQTPVTIAPRQKYTTIATLQSPAVNVGTGIEIVPSAGPDVGFSGYRASRVPDGSQGGLIRNLPMTVSQTGPSAVGITITNPNAFPVYLVTPAGAGFDTSLVGQPAVSIGGQAVVAVASATGGTVTADAQWPPVPDGGAAANPAGEILLALAANAWRQDLTSCQALAQYLLADLAISRPQWDNTTVLAFAPLQLGDRVTIIDQAAGMNEDAIVNRIVINPDMTMDLDLRAVRAPGGWLLGQAGSSELGSDATNTTIWV